MLDAKGNAVDAAVAAAFTLGVVTPYHSGIGGGGFALTWDSAKHEAAILDYRETAPKSASRDMFIVNGKLHPHWSVTGPSSVGVPGAVLGYLELLEKKGKLPRRVVLAPAIKAAREGFPVTPKYTALCVQRKKFLALDKDAARVFLRPGPDGKPDCPAIGTIITQPELAATLERLVNEGAKGFYAGPVAKAITEKAPPLTLEDLAGFKTRAREPLEGSYRDHRVLTMPLPSAGGLAVLQTLGVLEKATQAGIAERSVPAVHTYVETLRRVFADRGQLLGDPAFVDVPMAKLVSPAYLDGLAETINPKHATKSEHPDAGTPPHGHTSHVSVIDRDGNAIALTTTVNFYFGSCVWAAGFLLNDGMDDFTAQPGTPNAFGITNGEANAIAPGKIALSSMSPTLVFQEKKPDEVMLAVGAAGGPFIPTSVVQIISNVVDGHLAISRAIARPRVHHQWLPDRVTLEPFALDPATVTALQAMGHRFELEEKFADAEAVMVDPASGLRTSSADPRNEGAGMGQY
jgi:gamma-glutamyltranspeptidase/glutathione hydrolase